MALINLNSRNSCRSFFLEHPEEKEAQLAGHLLLWNKNPSYVEEERSRIKESGVKQKPYPYQTE